MSRHKNKIITSSKLPGDLADPRSRTFDPKLHKSLNAELKYLYTAITRTKCNLWIYDSNQKARLPLFDYWYKRDLVKVVRTGSSSDIEGMYNLVFASNSTTEQWKAQGDNFRRKHLWEQAKLCYERAGPENEYLVKEAQAYQLVKNSRQQKRSFHFEAALLFLECDRLHHGINYLTAAALCFRHAKPPKFTQAGKLYELLGESTKACQVYLRARDFDSFIRLKESIGEYSSVVMTLLGKPFMRKREALMKAREYEESGIELAPELSASKLSYSCAKFYSERKDKDTLIDVLQYMPEMERRVRLLKESKLYDRAFFEYEQSHQYADAYRLAAAQGWFKRGQELAKSAGNHDEVDSFILQKAKSKYKHTLAKLMKSGKNFTKDQVIEEIGQDVIDDLSSLFERGKRTRNTRNTYAALLLGMITSDKGLCRLAWRTFKHLKHKTGELEAFHQLQELADESIASVLEVCQLAKEVGKIFQSANDINTVVQQGLKFYDIRRVGQVYCTPRDQDIWMTDIIRTCQNETERVDIDGAHRLDIKEVRRCIFEHCTGYIKHWVNRFRLETELPYNCERFLLDKSLRTKRFPDREYAIEEVSSEGLRIYIKSCLEYFQLRVILEKDVEGLISLLIGLFSPQVTRYLPQRFNDQHIALLRQSTTTHSAFTHWLKESTFNPAKIFPERVCVDQWLTSWRACCLFSPDVTPIFSALTELETTVSKKAPEKKFEPPAGFVYKNKDNAYYHVFSMWLLSCQQIREHGDVLWGSRLAIFHFVSEIASSQCMSISVPNMVDILSLHCTVLLVILTHVHGRQNKPSSLTVPLLYKSTVQLFDSMVTFEGSKWKILQACAHEVGSKQERFLSRYHKDPRILLIRSLDILLGNYKKAPRYNVVKFALKKYPHNDATRHCLILTLTVFGNLIMLNDKQSMFMYHQKLLNIFDRIQDRQDIVPNYVEQVMAAIRSPSFVSPREVFSLVDKLLRMKGKQSLAKLVFKQSGKVSKVDFVELQIQQYSPRMHNYPTQPPPSVNPGFPPVVNLPSSTVNPMLPYTVRPVLPPAVNPVLPPTVNPVLSPAVSPGLPHTVLPPATNPMLPPAVNPVLPSTNQIPLSVTATLPSSLPQNSTHMSETEASPVAPAPITLIGTGRTTHPQAPQQVLSASGMSYYPETGMYPSMYPTEENSSWPTIFPYPSYLNMHPLSNQMGYNYNPVFPPVDGSYGAGAGLPPQPASIPRAAAVAATVIQDTQPPAVVSTSSSMPPTGGNGDLVNKHVVASCSIDELRQLATSKDNDDDDEMYHSDFDFSYDSEFSDNDQDYPEMAEEDGGFDQALTSSHTQAPALPPVDPELLDPSIVSQLDCSACGVSFSTEEDNAMRSVRYAHVTSDTHRSNTVLCKQFLAIVDSEEGEVSYPQLSDKLRELQTRCENLKSSVESEKLDKLIDNIKESQEKNDQVLTGLQERLAWREGIQVVNIMLETMDAQLFNGEKMYRELAGESHRTFVREISTTEELDTGELEMLTGERDESSKVNPGVEVKRMRSAAEKQASRQRKKEKKERQVRRGGANKK